MAKIDAHERCVKIINNWIDLIRPIFPESTEFSINKSHTFEWWSIDIHLKPEIYIEITWEALRDYEELDEKKKNKIDKKLIEHIKEQYEKYCALDRILESPKWEIKSNFIQ